MLSATNKFHYFAIVLADFAYDFRVGDPMILLYPSGSLVNEGALCVTVI